MLGPEDQNFLSSLALVQEDYQALHALVNTLPPDSQAILIVKRSEDNAVAYNTFGDLMCQDVIHMLATTQFHVLSGHLRDA
jgi:hypothetical protein